MVEINDEAINAMRKSFPSMAPEDIVQMAVNRLWATCDGVDDAMLEDDPHLPPAPWSKDSPEELFSQLLTKEEMDAAKIGTLSNQACD